VAIVTPRDEARLPTARGPAQRSQENLVWPAKPT
jgi:hypothetical protein